jgi:hypothetical protein
MPENSRGRDGILTEKRSVVPTLSPFKNGGSKIADQNLKIRFYIHLHSDHRNRPTTQSDR